MKRSVTPLAFALIVVSSFALLEAQGYPCYETYQPSR